MPYPNIYVPSRGRAEMLRTPYELPPPLQENCRVVVRHDELDDYVDVDEDRRFGFLALPKNFKGGLSETRQWILDNTDDPYHIQLDDDILSFNIKPRMEVFGGLRKATPVEVRRMFDWALRNLQAGYGCVGFSTRVGSARPSKVLHVENGNVVQMLFYRRDAIQRSRARFDRVLTSQDTDMNLQLLEHGYKNVVSLKYSFNSRPNRVSGGCEVYRTDELTEQQGRIMERLHPDVVELVPKQKPDGSVYNSLRVSWRRAYIPRAT